MSNKTMDSDKCFICFESDGTLISKSCKCVNVFAHKSCMISWTKIRKGDPDICEVCKNKYQDFPTGKKLLLSSLKKIALLTGLGVLSILLLSLIDVSDTPSVVYSMICSCEI